MSPAQHKFFYLREWSPCAKANGWNTQAGIAGPGRNAESLDDAALLAQVRACARQVALAEHRGERSNDFRYACHLVALGKNKSSLELTNDECTRVVDLFRVLREPLNLKFIAHWADADLSRKENLIAAAKAKANEAYIAVIMRGKFHTTIIEDLSVAQLRALCFTLNQRNASWRRPMSHEAAKVAKEEPEYAEGPF